MIIFELESYEKKRNITGISITFIANLFGSYCTHDNPDGLAEQQRLCSCNTAEGVQYRIGGLPTALAKRPLVQPPESTHTIEKILLG